MSHAESNRVYFDEAIGLLYTITWFDTGNNEIPTKHYIVPVTPYASRKLRYYDEAEQHKK